MNKQINQPINQLLLLIENGLCLTRTEVGQSRKKVWRPVKRLLIVLIDGSLNKVGVSLAMQKWTDFTLGHYLQEIQNLKKEQQPFSLIM